MAACAGPEAVVTEVKNFVGARTETPERFLQAAMARGVLYGMYLCGALNAHDLKELGNQIANYYVKGS